jgi:hypothetical protein
MKYSLPLLTLITFCASCNSFIGDDCNDCLELTSKRIKYVDSTGANLLFGQDALYDPDSIMIKAKDDHKTSIWKEETEGTITFDIERDHVSYYVMVTETLIDTLDFDLAERKSEVCCGNVTYSKRTFLNGQEVSNDDLIVITR